MSAWIKPDTRQNSITTTRAARRWVSPFLLQDQPKLFGVFDQFVADCKAGQLPQYSFLEPNYKDDDDLATISTLIMMSARVTNLLARFIT